MNRVGNRIGLAVGILALWSCSDGEAGHGSVSVEPTVSTETFAQSVASDDPRPQSIILWTRVVDDSRSNADYPVTLTLATDEELTSRVQQVSLTARHAHAHCVRTRVSELQPDTTYYYRFEYEDENETTAARMSSFS